MLYKITILFENSFCVGSGYGYAKLLDQATFRDEDEIPIIPGSTMKGKLRSACKRLTMSIAGAYQTPPLCQTGSVISGSIAAICKDPAQKCIICRLFGSPLFPSPYKFSDLKLSAKSKDYLSTLNKVRHYVEPAGIEQVTRVRRNRYLNTAENKALYTIEQVVLEKPIFSGIVSGPGLDSEELELLLRGLKSITHIGCGGAFGLGAINYEASTLEPERSQDDGKK